MEAGNRIIPLHSKTLILGFLNYVTQIKTSKSAEIVPKPKENEKHRLWHYDQSLVCQISTEIGNQLVCASSRDYAKSCKYRIKPCSNPCMKYHSRPSCPSFSRIHYHIKFSSPRLFYHDGVEKGISECHSMVCFNCLLIFI